VRAYIRTTVVEPEYKPHPDTRSILDSFKSYLTDRVNAAAPEQLPATVLLGEIQDLGYDGKITILRYCHLLKA
jgi:transposase